MGVEVPRETDPRDGQMTSGPLSLFARCIQGRMAKHLDPLPVHTYLLENVRDWKKWLEPLDDIKTVGGVTGMCFQGSAEWFLYARREDIPIEWARHAPTEDANESPADVMLMVKRFMADEDLSQPIIRFLHAGSSYRLSTHPSTWMARDALGEDYCKQLGHLLDLLATHFPEKAPHVAAYLRGWVNKPLIHHLPPPALPLLSHTYRTTGWQTQPVRQALAAATAFSDGAGPRVVSVQRKRRKFENPINLPLASWVAFQRSRGVDEEEAVQQWHGAQLLGG